MMAKVDILSHIRLQNGGKILFLVVTYRTPQVTPKINMKLGFYNQIWQ